MWGAAVVAGVALLVAFPPQRILGSVFGVTEDFGVRPAPGAFGESGAVHLHLMLPGEPFEFPVEFSGERRPASYQWVRAADSGAVTPDTVFTGATVRAPAKAGFYYIAVNTAGRRTVVGDVVVAVMVPFSEKVGSALNGYRIGTYRAERAGGNAPPVPRGFVEIWPDDADLWITRHLRLADFITHDGQERWPRYVVLDRRILDKVELVLAHLGARERPMDVAVNSGFRTPLYNRRVPRAASDSRHQYGDAVDLAFDADGDGRVSFFDVLAVSRAVDLVERDYPELVGGLGIYGNRGNAPYVHIDVRGERKRWRG